MTNNETRRAPPAEGELARVQREYAELKAAAWNLPDETAPASTDATHEETVQHTRVQARVSENQAARDDEITRLKRLIEYDRTGMAEALKRVRQIADGWSWLGCPESWGSYEYDERTEDTLRGEMRQCLEAITWTAARALLESGARVTMAFHGPREGKSGG